MAVLVTALLTTSAGEGEGGVVPVERVESVVTAGANCIVLVLSGLSSTAAPVSRRSGGEEAAGAGVTGGCDSAPAGGEDGGEEGGGDSDGAPVSPAGLDSEAAEGVDTKAVEGVEAEAVDGFDSETRDGVDTESNADVDSEIISAVVEDVDIISVEDPTVCSTTAAGDSSSEGVEISASGASDTVDSCGTCGDTGLSDAIKEELVS